MSVFNLIRGHIEKLYNCCCDIYVFENVISENGISNIFENLKYQSVSCRLSYNNTKKNINRKNFNLHYDIYFEAKLFYPPNIVIPVGSKIIIGSTAYKTISLPAYYVSHNEVLLAAYEYA